jgi:hypothetical protein
MGEGVLRKELDWSCMHIETLALQHRCVKEGRDGCTSDTRSNKSFWGWLTTMTEAACQTPNSSGPVKVMGPHDMYFGAVLPVTWQNAIFFLLVEGEKVVSHQSYGL